MEKSLYCEQCKRNYKSYQSLWNHRKRFHAQNIPIISPMYPHGIPNVSPEYPQNDSNILSNSVSNKNSCNYCKKTLSSYKNLHRHYQTCKLKLAEDIKKQKQEIENIQLRKDNEELRKMVEDLLKMKMNMINSHNKK